MIPIFKKKREPGLGESKKVIGVYLPITLAEWVTLYAMDRGKSSVSIVREQMEGLKFKKENEGTSLPFLIVSLARTAIDTYKELNKAGNKIDIDTFLKELRKDLSKITITEVTLEDLLNKIKDGTK